MPFCVSGSSSGYCGAATDGKIPGIVPFSVSSSGDCGAMNRW